MENQELIQLLKLQEKKLEGNLEAIRQTIKLVSEGFDFQPAKQVEVVVEYDDVDETIEAPKKVKPTPKAEKPVEKKEPKQNTPVLKGNELFPKKGYDTRRVVVPETYIDSASYTKKIAYLLIKEGNMSSVQLIDRISELEPNADKKIIERSVTIGASNMNRKGLVNSRREGRRYIYWI